MAFGTLSVKGRALRLLSGREHSRAELLRKLAPYEEEPGQLERVLDELQLAGATRSAAWIALAAATQGVGAKGMTGQQGLSEIAAALQIVRRGAGDSAEARAQNRRIELKLTER